MKLYNTLTRKVEELKPQRPPKVTVYTCGPTVYDYPHVGNWFTFLRYDILVRALKAAGYKPDWVMNITDVGHLVSDADEGEDKLEKGAKREGKNAWQIAEFYTKNFEKGLELLNITPPNHLPRATEHIEEQIDLIKDLEKSGYTYTTTDGVYYDTTKFATYGKMARLDLENLREGARVEVNPEKRNPTDFALWKLSPKDQKRDMEWQSPWGKGFPGWHLECSAMSMKYLGKTLDVHAGGIEHIPVHHTNEIAQSEAATGKPFAKIWVHMNHIMIGGRKIAKSDGNGITLEYIEKKGYSLVTLRLLVLESHYRTQAEFSWETLEAANNRLKNLQATADLRFQVTPDSGTLGSDFFANKRQEIITLLGNDLDTPSVLKAISETIDYIATFGTGLTTTQLKEFEEYITFLDDVLGFQLSRSKDISAQQKDLIHERWKAREAEDWQKSDEIRDSLKEDGIGLRDTQHDTIWYRL